MDLPVLAAAAVSAVLLLPVVIGYGHLLVQSDSPGAARPVVGTPYFVPRNAGGCDAAGSAAAESQVRNPVQAYCLPRGVSSRSLQRWATEHMPPGRPYAGQPWCDEQVLGDGSVLRRWGALRTSGYLVSAPRNHRASIAVVPAAPPCG